MKTTALLFALSLVAVPMTLAAQQTVPSAVSTAELQTSLQPADRWATLPPQQQVDAAFASGYVLGVADRLAASLQFCPPAGTTRVEVTAVVKKYLDQHPERWHYAPAALIQEALSASFACPAK